MNAQKGIKSLPEGEHRGAAEAFIASLADGRLVGGKPSLHRIVCAGTYARGSSDQADAFTLALIGALDQRPEPMRAVWKRMLRQFCSSASPELQERLAELLNLLPDLPAPSPSY